MREDELFAALCRSVPKPKAREALENVWISDTTWSIVDERVSTRRDPAREHTFIWRLGRAISAILRGYWIQQSEEAGKEVEKMLRSDHPLDREAWHQMKGWCRAVVDRAPLPAWATLERMAAERVDLYRYVPPIDGNYRVITLFSLW